MYHHQDSEGSVEDGEYHIMYGTYDPLKLGPDPPSPTTMKLTAVVRDDQGTLSAADGSLATVTLSTGGTLGVSPASLANGGALAVSSATLTSTSLSSHLVASTQVQDTTTTNPVMAISTVADESGLADADLDSSSDPLDVAALGSADQGRTTHVNIDQIVSTTDQTGLDGGQLVTSSSIDAVVTSVFTPDCGGGMGGAGGRKLPPQVVVKWEKFIGEDTLDLDVVRILPDTESGSHGFNLLTRNSTIVQKLSEGEIISEVEDDQYHPEEVLGSEERTEMEDEAVAGQCNVVWTCAYCSLAFSSSEAVACHQEKDCTKNPAGLQTSTSQATVDALMSPLRPPDDPTYEFKLERTSSQQQTDDMAEEHNISQESSTVVVEEERELVTVWPCSVCGVELPKSEALNDHYSTHTLQELSSALVKLTVPCQIVKKRHKVRSTDTDSSASAVDISGGDTVHHRSAFASDSSRGGGGQLKWSEEHSEVSLTKVEEVFVMETPGDTPPHTPPQEKLLMTKRTKKKPGPKARPRDKNNEKRKYVRKTGEDTGQPTSTMRQREHHHRAPPPPGQGSRDPHTCQVCNKVLSSRGNLSKHMVLHKDKKPFVCNLCGAEFNAKRDKHHHYLQHHTKERPNVCHICGKGYVDSNYLHEHMVFHQQERSFSCDVCGKLFHTVRCVARHKKRHGKDRNFDCEQCFRSFGIKADLASHQRKVHGNAKRTQAGRQQQHQQQQVMIQHNGQQQQQGIIQHNGQQQQTKTTKELSEFVLPGSPPHIVGEEQLLQGGELEPQGSHKDDGIFLTDSLPMSTIIPIAAATGGETCPYGVTLAAPTATQGTGETGGGAQATYIMIEGAASGGDVVSSTHTLPPAPAGLIMYTPVTAATSQEVGEDELLEQLAPQQQHQQHQLVVGMGVREEEEEEVVGDLHTTSTSSLCHHHHHHQHQHTQHRQTQGTGGLVEDEGPAAAAGLALDAAAEALSDSTTTAAGIRSRGRETHNTTTATSHDRNDDVGGPHHHHHHRVVPPQQQQPCHWSYSVI